MGPQFFKTSGEFRKWLQANHKKETELIVGFYKVDSGKPSMTWSQSVDQALCFGWIDGVRRSIDENSYSIRFTPRKPTSIWSAINIQKIKDLTKKGLMKPEGLVIFKNRKDKQSSGYTHGKEEIMFTPSFEKKFKANKIAWNYFRSLAPGYQNLSKKWVMSAKQEATRISRITKLIKDCEAGTNQWKENKYTKK